MITEQILESIDNINTTVGESSYCVLESMCSLIEKELLFEENCSPMMIQEGEILNEVKNKGKKDKNRLITILKFLPRLIAAIFNSIKKHFTDSNLGKEIKDAVNNLEREADVKAKEARIAEINARNDTRFQLYVTENGKIKVKKDKQSVLAALGWFATTADLIYNLFSGIKDEFDLQDPSNIRKFADQCDKIIRKQNDKSRSEVFDMGLDALGDLVSHITKTSASIAALGVGTQSAIEVQISKLEAAGEQADGKLTALSDLLSKINIINASIAAAGIALKGLKKFGDYAGMFIKADEQGMEDNNVGREEFLSNVILTDERTRQYPREDNETDDDYLARMIRSYYEDQGVPPTKVKDYYSADLKKAAKKARKNRKADADKEYNAASEKYKADKKKLHEQHPIFGSDKSMEEIPDSDEPEIV